MYKHLFGLFAGMVVLGAVAGNANSATLEPLNIKLKPKPALSGIATVQNKVAAPQQPNLNRLLNMGKNESLESQISNVDPLGNRHVRYRQMYNGLPVWGQQVVVHDRDKELYAVSGNVARDLEKEKNLVGAARRPDVGTSGFPNAPSEDKIKIKAEQWWLGAHAKDGNKWTLEHQDDSREIYIHSDGNAYVVRVITYLAKTPGKMPARPTVIIDESSRKILKAWDGLTHAEATGPGGNEKVGRYVYGTDKPYLQVTETAAGCVMESDLVRTIDYLNQEDIDFTEAFQFECYDNQYKEVNGAYSPINDAHYFSSVVINMYQDWVSVNPFPEKINARVHFGEYFDNAFWDGNAIHFGDGNDEFFPFTVLDITSHEISHGFTERNSNLIYDEESGGINESFSDIAGEAAELYLTNQVDWLAGADLVKSGEPLRYFEDPTRDGNSIGHADDYYKGMDVHFSSGVYNRAFYLLAHSPGWSVQTGFQVFAHANQNYWVPSTNFAEGVCGVLNAASDLVMPLSDIAVAFGKVGLLCSTDNTDTDADGIPDGWEALYGFDHLNPADAADDADIDGLTNLGEFQNQSDPHVMDSDADGLSDGDEVTLHGTSPVLADTDGDAIPDSDEIEIGLDPLDPEDRNLDNDGDSVTNFEEFLMGTDPFDAGSVAQIFAQFHERFESGIADDWVFSSTGNQAGWKVNKQWFSEGAASFKAAGLGDGDSVSIEVIRLLEAGELSLDYRVSSEENFDNLLIVLDGEEVVKASGEQSDSLVVALQRGVHTLQISYTKDADTSVGDDAAWVDNLKFIGNSVDRDNDGMPDLWEIRYQLDPASAADASLDSDSDGLTNLEEFQNNADPHSVDTDADGLSDADEVNVYGTSPSSVDTDGDGISDQAEILFDLNPLDGADADLDPDNDGFSNRDELSWGTDPHDGTSAPVREVYFKESFENDLLSDEWILSASDSAVNWSINSNWSSDGEQSLAVIGLQDSQSTTAELVKFVAEGKLTFDYRVSTEQDYDLLRVLVDDVEVLLSSGEDEGRFEMQLGGGRHRIQFVFEKDDSVAFNENAVWIDNIEFTSESADSDGDGMPDGWEISWQLDINNPDDAALDGDADGLSNLDEYLNKTSPQLADTDGDTLSDGDEVLVYGTSPIVDDTDSDRLPDSFEVANLLDPLDATDAEQDADSDGATNLDEYITNTDPNDALSVADRIANLRVTFETEVPQEWVLSSVGTDVGWQRTQGWSQQGAYSLGIEKLAEVASSASVEMRYLFDEGTLRFDFRVLSDPTFNAFEIVVDGETVRTVGGEEVQERFQIDLDAGAHVIRLVLQGPTMEGQTTSAWIDNLRFESNNPDIDGDGMATDWELLYNLDPEDPSDAALDNDNDGLTNLEEYAYKTNPTLIDSDGDGLNDGDEVNLYRTSPISSDSDTDGMSDLFEVNYRFDPLDAADAQADRDNDGFTNLQESQWGTDPDDSSSLPVAVQFFAESFEDGIPADWTFTSEDQHWNLDSGWSSDGAQSLAIAQLADGQTASVEFSKLFAAGTLSFDYRTSTEEGYDLFRVVLDGEEVLSASGESTDTFSINLEAGTHTLELVYVKDSSDFQGEDRVWVDNFRFVDMGEDHDNDGMSTVWEREHGLDPFNALDALMDPDEDGFSNYQEFKQDSDPFVANVDVSVNLVQVIETDPNLIHYQLQVRNRGLLPAKNVVVENRIPAELVNMVEFIPQPESQLNCDWAEFGLRCDTELMVGKSKDVFDIRVFTADSKTQYDFSASVTTAGVEHNSSNDSASKQYAGSLQWLNLLLLGLLGSLWKQQQ